MACPKVLVGCSSLDGRPVITPVLVWDGRRDHTHEPYALIGIRDLPTHIRRRKVWNSALNTASVKAYEPILRTRLDQLVDIFESGAERAQGNGAKHNLTDLLSFFA